jgi:acyl-CoA thioesterase-1
LAQAAGFSVEIRNAGLSGETSAGARRRLGWILEGETFDLFILETGANDGLRGLPLADLEENLDAILAAVRGRAPAADILVVGMEAPTNLGAAYTEGFRAIFPRVAERWEATLIPFLLEGVAGEPSLNQADRIHPTAEGQAIMAQVAWERIGAVLKGRERAAP